MKKKDELWEMNIHENPMDDDVKEKLLRTELSLKNNHDPFIDFVRHAESKFKYNCFSLLLMCKDARKKKIYSEIFEEKLR